MQHQLIKLFLIFALIFTLSGCNDNDSWCEGSPPDAYDDINSIKKVNNTALTIYSVSAEYEDGAVENYGKWVDSKFSVKKGDEFDIFAEGQIVIADDYYDNTKDGLGKKYVIPANKTDLTLIPDFEFVQSQQVTITTEDCTIGSSSYCNPSGDPSCYPTKWTWNSAWKYDSVKCDYTDIYEFYFEGDPSKICNAYRCCGGEDMFGTCWGFDKWKCWHEEDLKENAYSAYDLCPATSGYTTKTAEPFICDGNQGSAPCYAATNPPYKKDDEGDDEGDCDGGGDDHSGQKKGFNSAPPCGARDKGNNERAKEPLSFNRCGYEDSCWGTGGFRLYAIDAGSQCPAACEDYAGYSGDNPCPEGCTHLEGSYKTFDETHGDNTLEAGDFVAGTSFAYSNRSGHLYLSIINPRSSDELEDVGALQEEIEDKEKDIETLEAEIEALEALLVPQLDLINGYSGDMVDLRDDAILLNDGIVGDPDVPENQALKDQLSSIKLLFTDTVIDSKTGETSKTGIEATFSTFDEDIEVYKESLSSSSTSAEEESPLAWVITSERMKTESLDIIDKGNALSTAISGEGSTTTSDDLNTYKQNLNSIMSQLNVEIDYALKLQQGACTADNATTCTETKETEGIDDKNEKIAQLEAEIEDLNQAILEATSYDGNTDLIGGYTVYVKAGGLVGDNGQYLCAVISDVDPNVPGNEKYVTNLFCNDKTQMFAPVTYTMPVSGNIWLKIVDPDERYDNNSEYYTLTMGKVTYVSGFSKMTEDLIKLIKNTVTNTSERIFKNLTCSETENKTSNCIEYGRIITAMLYLYVIIFGMMYLFGLIKADHVDFVLRIVKMAAVIILIQPGSFDFFNTYLFNGFFGFSDTLISYATGAPTTNPFDFIALNMNVLVLDEATFFKIIGVMFQGLMGLVAFALLLHGVVTFVCAFFKAFVVYMISFVGLGLCFATGPIFIVFLLFNKTSYLFDNWFKMMVKYTVQPVILLVGLIIINGMLAAIIEEIFNYYVCFKCTLPFIFALPGFPDVGTTTLFCVSWFSPWGADNVDSPLGKALMSLPLAISFCMVATAMKIYADKIATDVAGQIVGSSSGITKPTGSTSMGLNPLKGLDQNAFGLSKATGLAKDEKEYKALRNKVLRTAAKASMVLSSVGSPMETAATLSRLSRSKKKDMNPESLKNTNNKDSK